MIVIYFSGSNQAERAFLRQNLHEVWFRDLPEGRYGAIAHRRMVGVQIRHSSK
jgi:hypothetical protein